MSATLTAAICKCGCKRKPWECDRFNTEDCFKYKVTASLPLCSPGASIHFKNRNEFGAAFPEGHFSWGHSTMQHFMAATVNVSEFVTCKAYNTVSDFSTEFFFFSGFAEFSFAATQTYYDPSPPTKVTRHLGCSFKQPFGWNVGIACTTREGEDISDRFIRLQLVGSATIQPNACSDASRWNFFGVGTGTATFLRYDWGDEAPFNSETGSWTLTNDIDWFNPATSGNSPPMGCEQTLPVPYPGLPGTDTGDTQFAKIWKGWSGGSGTITISKALDVHPYAQVETKWNCDMSYAGGDWETPKIVAVSDTHPGVPLDVWSGVGTCTLRAWVQFDCSQVGAVMGGNEAHYPGLPYSVYDPETDTNIDYKDVCGCETAYEANGGDAGNGSVTPGDPDEGGMGMMAMIAESPAESGGGGESGAVEAGEAMFSLYSRSWDCEGGTLGEPILEHSQNEYPDHEPAQWFRVDGEPCTFYLWITSAGDTISSFPPPEVTDAAKEECCGE